MAKIDFQNSKLAPRDSKCTHRGLKLFPEAQNRQKLTCRVKNRHPEFQNRIPEVKNPLLRAQIRLLEAENRLTEVQNRLSLAPINPQRTKMDNWESNLRPKPQNLISDVDFGSLGASFPIGWVDTRGLFLTYLGIIDLERLKIDFLGPIFTPTDL